MKRPIRDFLRSTRARTRRAGLHFGRAGRVLLTRLVDVVLPLEPSQPLPDPSQVRSILLVRPNFRIGNALLLAPLVPALRERFPTATLDVLIGDIPAVLLEGLPIDRVHTVSRQFLLRPWDFAALFLRLRRKHYDLVLEGGMGSLSGALYGWLAGGRWRAGTDGPGRRLLHIRFDEPRVAHVYDWSPALARQLGASCAPSPLFTVLPADDDAACAVLREHRLADGSNAQPFLLVFPGGHLRKRWPDAQWLEVCAQLAGEGVQVLVSLGPEEQRFDAPLHKLAPLGVRRLPPGPIRVLAAILARASLVVTADSGPLHLSVAVGAPTLALLQDESSRRYAPRGPRDHWLMQPTVENAVDAIRMHPAWAELTAPRGSRGKSTRDAATSDASGLAIT